MYAKGEQGPTLTVMGLIQGVHDALEAAMVCALGEKSLRDEDEKTMGFTYLLERCQDPTLVQKPLKLDKSEVCDMKQTHKNFRGDLAHPKPNFRPINYGDVPKLVVLHLKAVEQLMSDELWLNAPDDDQKKKRFDIALETIRANLHRPLL
jgi:hypothetical protein